MNFIWRFKERFANRNSQHVRSLINNALIQLKYDYVFLKNNFYLNKPFCNIFEQPNKLSKKSSQILYGEKFKIISKVNDYFKIKTKYDNYYGYIKIGNFPQKFSSNFKVIVLKSYIYKEPRNSSKTKICLPFSSEINVFDRKSNFLKFGKNQWVKRNDVVKKNIKLKNYVNTFKLFRNCKFN